MDTQRWRLVAASAFLLQLGWSARADQGPPQTHTLGFVVVSLRTAAVESPYLDECPEGVAIGNDEIWWKSLSPRERDRLTEGGEKEASSRRQAATIRGPQGQDVCWNPASVQDPPMRVVRGALSEGLNLDGTPDGRTTAASCRHKKFTTPDGRSGVDNQMRRAVGCIHGWRSNGYIEMTSDTERRNSSQGILLIQISGVQSLQNSPDVTVRFFRAADVMPKDSKGDILPFASYRIDGNPRYGVTAKGRIHDGMLTTDPVDTHLPFYGNRVETEFLIKGLRLELQLSPGHANGILAGYHDLENWWDYVRKMGYLVETAQFSCPALYTAARDLADGYPDPATGACTALSVAYKVEAVSAFVVEQPKQIPIPFATPIGDINLDAMPVGIRRQSSAAGDVLSEGTGKTLYVATSDRCDTACEKAVVPLQAPWTRASSSQWATTVMRDLTPQWVLLGHPIYTCVGDSNPGDVTCANEHWRPVVIRSRAALPTWLTVHPSELGPIVGDGNGRTIYRLIGSLAPFEKEICDEACMKAQWHPVPAETDAPTVTPWTHGSVDGQDVWMFQGSPVYTFAGDDGPSQIAGHRFGGASISTKNWFSAIRLDEATQTAVQGNSKQP